MRHFQKWIEGVSSDESVYDAAQRSLQIRLDAVEHFLPLAADRAEENIEFVHQLRVYSRRSMAVLKLYRNVLPKKETKWLRKTLRKIRRAAGNARDMDVLAQSHEADGGKEAEAFLGDVQRRRDAAQKPIVAIHRKLTRDDCLRRHVNDLLRELSAHSLAAADDSFGPWASSRLKRILKRFFKAFPSDRRDLASLHRFRIRGKELRYAMELLASAFPAEFREELYPLVERLQEQLGQIHDCAVARDRLTKWVTGSKTKKQARHVRKLIEEEDANLDKFLGDFAAVWTPDFQMKLQESFEKCSERSPTVSCA